MMCESLLYCAAAHSLSEREEAGTTGPGVKHRAQKAPRPDCSSPAVSPAARGQIERRVERPTGSSGAADQVVQGQVLLIALPTILQQRVHFALARLHKQRRVYSVCVLLSIVFMSSTP